ncbi:MAG: ATP-binding cassette domain-containing protein, partial [Clostridiales bacterium]|nr:ATP-binding cassette domain-containing protein [Clostridiales bacterium]
TLLNIITGRIFADEGEALYDGVPVAENDSVQGRIYMMSEANHYPEGMRVSDMFRWSREFYGGFDTERAHSLSEAFGLNTRSRVKTLSTGYNTLCKAIVALCVDAPFILLDEPVLGLDAHHRELLYRSLLECYARKPRTYIISTHLIEEVSGVIEHVAILHRGRILRDCPCEELLTGGYTVSGPAAAVDAFTADKAVLGGDTLGGLKSVCILSATPPADVPAGIEITRLSLQKLFIRMTE